MSENSPYSIHLKTPAIPIDRPPRVLICTVKIPFISGGAERHIQSLVRELKSRSFDVDVIELPLKWDVPRQIINDVLSWRLLDLTHSYGLPIDLIIGMKFPAYVIRHPRKIAWVLHQHRQMYDMLSTPYTDFHDTIDDDEVRRLLYQIDKKALSECSVRFANSKNVANRMQCYLHLSSEPLYHPPPLSGQYRCDEYGDFILSVARLELNKRVDLLIKALALTSTETKAVIVGSGPQEANLKELAVSFGVSDRISFVGQVTDSELLNYYSRCGIVYYAPFDEDYGYVTLEAFLSDKSVITTHDAGGVLEFVSNEFSGLVADPEPNSIAKRIDDWRCLADSGREYALRGKEIVRKISWDHVVDRLTESIRYPDEVP